MVANCILSFLLVDICTSFGENLYANVPLLRNRKFDLISQSGWIILHATITCDTSTCVTDRNDEPWKESVIDYVRETDKESVPIFSDRARAKSVRKCKHAPRHRGLSRILYKKASSLFSDGKVIKKSMVHYLKQNVLSSFELRKCLSLAFRKYIAPTCRPQLRRNKSSRVGDSNRRVYLTSR